MIKKNILSGFLCFALGVTSVSVYAQEDVINLQSEEPVEQVLPGGQVAVESDGVETGPTNEIIESAYVHRMAQQKKADDLKENDSAGGAVTIIAMVIVVGALAILSILFLIFGKISSSMLSKKKAAATGKTVDPDVDHDDHLDSGEVIAAIAAALAEHFGQGHDLEDTILTIRQMKRSYSPWNSKIYNMRELPELKRGSRTISH